MWSGRKIPAAAILRGTAALIREGDVTERKDCEISRRKEGKFQKKRGTGTRGEKWGEMRKSSITHWKGKSYLGPTRTSARDQVLNRKQEKKSPEKGDLSLDRPSRKGRT